tara:strand:- start:1935 stop:2657 length:723 start_codon:yes stop_codon:yes gene_type:complete
MDSDNIEYISRFDRKTKIVLKSSEKVFVPTATSEFLIKAVAENIVKVDKLLDLGCGNGIVGITLSKLNKAENIFCSDISKEAVRVANENISLNSCLGKAIYSDIFSGLKGNIFNIIVNDISGISEDIASLSSWFDNVPCDSGKDGCKNIEKVLIQSKKFLADKGKLYFPVLNLSDTKKILDIAKKQYISVKLISHDEWFLPDDLAKHRLQLISLKKAGFIDYCEKFGKVICWTDIYEATP